MKNEKKYITPSINFIEISKEDVIVTSGDTFNGPNQMQDDYTDNNFWGTNGN